MYISCNVTLETYACARVRNAHKENVANLKHGACTMSQLPIFYKQLENFTVGQLVSLLQCDLPGNSSRSIVLWKMLLTKLSFILDPALDALAVTVGAPAV